MNFQHTLFVLVLLICLIIAPCLAAGIPSEERIHPGGTIPYGQNITYIDSGVIPCGAGYLYLLSPDNTTISYAGASFTTYSYEYKWATNTYEERPVSACLGGYIDGNISTSPGRYYSCINPLSNTGAQSELINYCSHLFTVLPEPRGSANISIDSTPGNASVYLDGDIRGLTPRELVNVPNGNHTLVIRLEGYLDSTSVITVNATDQAVSAELAARQPPSPVPATVSPAITTPVPVTPAAVPTQETTIVPFPSNATSPFGNLVGSIRKFFGLYETRASFFIARVESNNYNQSFSQNRVEMGLYRNWLC